MVVNNHVYYAGPMSAPKCPSYQELLRAALGLLRAEKQTRKKSILRIYGFEGDARRQGEVFTRNWESSSRRLLYRLQNLDWG